MGTTGVEVVLSHHGVKGQKWGVRKDRGHEGETASKREISKADKKFDRSLQGINGWIKVQNTFAKHANDELESLNNNPKYKDKDLYADKKLHTDYYNDYEKLVDRATKKTSDEIGQNASGTKQLKVTRTGFGENSTWRAEMVDVEHADNQTFTMTVTVDKLGHVTELVVHRDSVQQGESFVTAFLEHHGIKGQRWGVRKGKGTATAVSVKATPGRRIKVSGGANQPAHDDAIRAKTAGQKAKKSSTDSLSNKELQDLVTRMNLEQQLSKLSGSGKTKAGAKFATDILANVAKQQVTKVVNDQVSKQIGIALNKK